MTNPIQHTTTEIVLCNQCKGSGIVWHERMIDHHRSEYERTPVACGKCKGSGRMLRSISEKPYQPIALPTS